MVIKGSTIDLFCVQMYSHVYVCFQKLIVDIAKHLGISY